MGVLCKRNNHKTAVTHKDCQLTNGNLSGRERTGPIRRLLGGKRETCQHSLRTAPEITTTLTSDGKLTGSITLPSGVSPQSINFRASTEYNGQSKEYTVTLPRGKNSSEFLDTRNQERFCKMTTSKNPDGTHKVDFTLYEQATKATLFIPGYQSQNFSRESHHADPVLAKQGQQAIDGQPVQPPEHVELRHSESQSNKDRSESPVAAGFDTILNKDGSITAKLHLEASQAYSEVSFAVVKKDGGTRSTIKSSLNSDDTRARVDGFYDVSRTINADGSATLEMTLPAGQLKGKLFVGEQTFICSSKEQKQASNTVKPDASDTVVEQPSTTEADPVRTPSSGDGKIEPEGTLEQPTENEVSDEQEKTDNLEPDLVASEEDAIESPSDQVVAGDATPEKVDPVQSVEKPSAESSSTTEPEKPANTQGEVESSTEQKVEITADEEVSIERPAVFEKIEQWLNANLNLTGSESWFPSLSGTNQYEQNKLAQAALKNQNGEKGVQPGNPRPLSTDRPAIYEAYKKAEVLENGYILVTKNGRYHHTAKEEPLLLVPAGGETIVNWTARPATIDQYGNASIREVRPFRSPYSIPGMRPTGY